MLIAIYGNPFKSTAVKDCRAFSLQIPNITRYQCLQRYLRAVSAHKAGRLAQRQKINIVQAHSKAHLLVRYRADRALYFCAHFQKISPLVSDLFQDASFFTALLEQGAGSLRGGDRLCKKLVPRRVLAASFASMSDSALSCAMISALSFQSLSSSARVMVQTSFVPPRVIVSIFCSLRTYPAYGGTAPAPSAEASGF